MSQNLKKIQSFWSRQRKGWRIAVIRAIFHRFFLMLTMDYSNIYIMGLGATPIQLGSLNSITHLANTISATPLGWIQDKYSLKKFFIIGVGLFTFVPLLFAIAQNWFFIIPAMFLTIFSWPCSTICDVSLKKTDRATGKALCEVVGSIPSLFAPTIAAFIISLFGGINTESVRPLFWIQLFGEGIIFIYVFKQMSEIKRPEYEDAEKKPGFIQDFMEIFQRGTAVKRWILFSTIGMFIVNMTLPFRSPFAYEIKGANQFIIGGMASASLIVQVLFATPLGHLADKIGRKKVFYALAPLYWASNLILVFSPNPELLIFSGILLGFQNITNIALLSSIRAELVPIDCLGRWMGILSLFGGFASIIASFIGGLIWENFNPSYIFLLFVAIDVFLRLPIIATLPETLNLELKK
jgi:MFS family permease